MNRRVMQSAVHSFLLTESCPVGAIPIRMSWERGRVDPYVKPFVRTGSCPVGQSSDSNVMGTRAGGVLQKQM